MPNELSAIDSYFTSYISVFGIHIVGTSRVDNDKLLHSAHVLAEYLDNDQDGIVDDPSILEEIAINAYKKVKKNHGWEKVANHLNKFL